MALTGDETYGTVIPGFVTDADGNLSVTTDTGSVQWREGFLRDLDGRLVVAEAGGIMQDGLLRTAGGALCVTTGSVTQEGTVIPGLPTDDEGRVCVVNDGLAANGRYPGFKFDSGKLCVTGLITTVYAESWDAAGVAGWDQVDGIVTRTTTGPHTAPGALEVKFVDSTPTPVCFSPIFDASDVSQVAFWAKRVGTLPDSVYVVLSELDVGESEIASHPLGTLTTSISTSWTEYTYPLGDWTTGVKGRLFFVSNLQVWGANFVTIDDVLVEGSP
jgi:hypothetical protein